MNSKVFTKLPLRKTNARHSFNRMQSACHYHSPLYGDKWAAICAFAGGPGAECSNAIYVGNVCHIDFSPPHNSRNDLPTSVFTLHTVNAAIFNIDYTCTLPYAWTQVMHYVHASERTHIHMLWFPTYSWVVHKLRQLCIVSPIRKTSNICATHTDTHTHAVYVPLCEHTHNYWSTRTHTEACGKHVCVKWIVPIGSAAMRRRRRRRCRLRLSTKLRPSVRYRQEW